MGKKSEILKQALLEAEELELASMENAKNIIFETFNPDMVEFFKSAIYEAEEVDDEDMEDDDDVEDDEEEIEEAKHDNGKEPDPGREGTDPEPSSDAIAIPLSLTRDEQIAFLVIYKGVPQIDIASQFDISQQRVSQIVQEFKYGDAHNNKLVKIWEKDISNTMMLKAGQTAASIDPDKIPEGSKATTVGILIDKTRLIQGESTENIASIVSYRAAEKDLERQDKAERELRRRLGLQPGDPIPTN